jgi:hypothetical protein
MTPQSGQSRIPEDQIRFQWQAMVRPAALEAGWQDRLTSQLFAVATVRVPTRGPIAPNILQVQVMGNMERLYKARVREGAVEVRVAYDALARMDMGELPPCELLIKTTDGGHGVTLAPPTPPSAEDWQNIVEQFWSQLQQEKELRLDWGIAPYQPGQSGIFLPQRMLLSRFRLFPHLQWEAAPQHLLDGGKPSTWQRELRLVRDPFHPWVLHAQVGWREPEEVEEALAPLLLEEEPEEDEEPEVLAWEQEFSGLGDDESAPGLPGLAGRRPLKPPSPAPINWQDLFRRRGGVLLAGALLLAFIVLGTSVLAFGIVGNASQTGPTAPAIAQGSPTGAAGNQASPTLQATALSTSTASASTSPSPTSTTTSTPTATVTPAPIVNWSVATAGATSQRCSPPHPNVGSLTLTINNSKSTAALTWQVILTDTDPAGKVWATASPTSGTIPAGQQAQVTVTPISSLCADMAGSQNSITYHAVVSGSAAGQSKQVTIAVTVKP